MSASIVTDQRRGFGVALALNVDEPVEAAFEPRAHGAPVVAAIRHRDGFEAGAVVPFEHAGDLRRHRMRPEIGGEIDEPDALVPIALAAPQRLETPA